MLIVGTREIRVKDEGDRFTARTPHLSPLSFSLIYQKHDRGRIGTSRQTRLHRMGCDRLRVCASLNGSRDDVRVDASAFPYSSVLPCGCRLRRREESTAAGEEGWRGGGNAQLSSGEGEKRRTLNVERRTQNAEVEMRGQRGVGGRGELARRCAHSLQAR
jgi:hypothetical protein